MKPGNGLTGVRIMPDDVPGGTMGVRYFAKVTHCDSGGADRKVRNLFGPHHLTGPLAGGGLRHAIETAFFSYGVKYSDDAKCPGWPPASVFPYRDEPALWVRVGNVIDEGVEPVTPLGIRPLNDATRERFPRANFGVDGRKNITSIDCIEQRSALGKTYEIAVGRKSDVKLDRPMNGYGHRFSKGVCTPDLPPGTYSRWRVQLTATYKFDVLFPLGVADYVNPLEAASLFSEFWQEEQAIAVEAWGFAIKTGGVWKPVKRVQYHFHPDRKDGDQTVPYGPRVLKNGHLELSNDQPASAYLPAGAIIPLRG